MDPENQLSKQNKAFIQDELLNKGFKLKEVLDHLATFKQNGDNLQNWNFDELINALQPLLAKIQQKQYNYPLFPPLLPQNGQTVNGYSNDNENQNGHLIEAKKIGSNNQIDQIDRTSQQDNNFQNEKKLQYPLFQQSMFERTSQQFIDYFFEGQDSQPQANVIDKPKPKEQKDEVTQQEGQQINKTYSYLGLQNSVYVDKNQFQSSFKDPIDPQGYYKQIPCQKYEQIKPNQTNLEPFQVIVSGYEAKTEGLFKKVYFSYKIELLNTNNFIYRRYTDFVDLRQYLTKNYPEMLIPPIPKKNKKLEPEQRAQERLIFLEVFCKGVVANQDLKIDPVVRDFFTEDKGFQNTISKEQKQQRLLTLEKNVENLRNNKGILDISITSSLDQYIEQKQQTLEQTEEFDKKIKKLYKKIVQQNTTLQNTLEEISLVYCQKYQTLQNSNLAMIIGKNQKLENINICLRNFFHCWSLKIQEQNSFMQKYIKKCFSYHKYETQEVLQLIKFRENEKNELSNLTNKLEQKKDKFFKEGNFEKWDIPNNILKQIDKEQLKVNKEFAVNYMFPKETEQVTIAKNNYGYINQKIYENIMLQENHSIYSTVMIFIAFCQQQSKIDVQNQNPMKIKFKWSDMIEYFKNLGEGSSLFKKNQ